MAGELKPPDSVATLLARARKLERSGDYPGAVAAYEDGLGRSPDHRELLSGLAQLASRMEMHATAASLWERVSALGPLNFQAIEGRSRALRELGQFEQAMALLRGALLEYPQQAKLWGALAVTLVQAGRTGEALTFFGEALRLDPASVPALYNRGGAYVELGDLEAARADYRLAQKHARGGREVAQLRFALSLLDLDSGELTLGWEGYEARFSPDLPHPVVFDIPGRRWTPRSDLAGRRLLVVAEQGVGDELMFANVLPDVVRAIGEDGQLFIAVEPRLVDLFQRSFPRARVSAHDTEIRADRRRRFLPDDAGGVIDFWTPMGSLMARFRPTISAFPPVVGYLRPDPERMAHWRSWLGDGAPTVGITWRSAKLEGDRRRLYPPLEHWGPIVRTPGLRFVNLQYGECGEELAELKALTGIDILQAPGLNIREDLDDLAALCASLDQVVSIGNATGMLAGAVGCPLAIIDGPGAWPRLGAAAYPWFPQALAFSTATFSDWEQPMAEVRSHLTRQFGYA